MNPTNCHALFATSGLLAILAFALQSPLAAIPSCPLDDVCDFFILIRGIKTVLRGAYFDRIRKGKLKALLDHDWHPPVKQLRGDAERAFHRLGNLNITAVGDPDHQETYDAVLHSLRRAFETHSVFQHEESLVLGIWTASLSSLYISLVRSREPMALMILALYGVLLHDIKGIWWSEGRGARLIQAVRHSLPTTWRSELQWPNDIIQDKCALNAGE